MDQNHKKDGMWILPATGPSPTVQMSEPDAFKNISSSNKFVVNLVREACQNTLDATDDATAVINFNYYKDESLRYGDYSKFFSGLNNFIKKSQIQDEAPEKIKPGEYKQPDFILIQDYGTGGVEGEIGSDRENNFWQFFLNWGISNKNKNRIKGNLGQKGLGRQAFLWVSRIKSCFVLSKRANDKALCGMSFLNAHSDEGVQFAPQAVFAKGTFNSVYELHSGSEQEVTDDEETLVNDFEHKFKIDFEEDETGTAIVIPLPRIKVSDNFEVVAKASLIENFAPSIIKGDFKPSVEDSLIDSENILKVAEDSKSGFIKKNFKKDPSHFLGFLDKVIYTTEDFDVEKNLDLNLQIDASTFSIAEKEKIKYEYNHKGFCILKINFKVIFDNNPIDTHIIVSLGKPPSEKEGVEM